MVGWESLEHTPEGRREDLATFVSSLVLQCPLNLVPELLQKLLGILMPVYVF